MSFVIIRVGATFQRANGLRTRVPRRSFAKRRAPTAVVGMANGPINLQPQLKSPPAVALFVLLPNRLLKFNSLWVDECLLTPRETLQAILSVPVACSP